MIDFRPLTIGDKALVESYTIPGQRHNCDLSFANLVSWRFLYNTQIAVVEGCLAFRFHIGGNIAYMVPLPKPKPGRDGEMRTERCDEVNEAALKAITEDSIAMGQPLKLMGVCNYIAEILESKFPGKYDIRPERSRADYIYTREKLSTLSGKKMQGKRNFVNRFKRLFPGYEYKELTPGMVPQCIALEQQWRSLHGQPGQRDSQTAELRSMTRAFNRWEQLGLRGGTLWVDGKLVAFTFGCQINHCTFDICVEKADTSYEGAFNTINYEFARHLPEHFFYINREEDLGDEGLRQAKLSYRPDILLEKNSVTETDPSAAFLEEEAVKAQTRELWEKTFQDPKEFTDLYFSKVYKPDTNHTVQIARKVAAALQAIPFGFRYMGADTYTAYISGVAVESSLRGQGIGRNLMKQAHYSIARRGVPFAMLIPADEKVGEWYEKQGYAGVAERIDPPTETLGKGYPAFDKWQRGMACALNIGEEWWDTAMEDMVLAGVRQEAPREPRKAMARIANAEVALGLYAAAHPEENIALRITGDQDIPENNTYYIIGGGKCTATNEPQPEADTITIGQAAQIVFKECKAALFLVMD